MIPKPVKSKKKCRHTNKYHSKLPPSSLFSLIITKFENGIGSLGPETEMVIQGTETKQGSFINHAKKHEHR